MPGRARPRRHGTGDSYLRCWEWVAVAVGLLLLLWLVVPRPDQAPAPAGTPPACWMPEDMDRPGF